MLIFAHILAGALLGLGFWHITNDRRAVLFCIIGSILPDLIDKPLGFLFPSVFGGGRTVFHALIISIVILFCIFLFFQSPVRWLGSGMVCALLLHQAADEMWTLPENWFFPFLGPFRGDMISDYILTYFWLEISSPFEWMFMMISVVILIKTYYR